MSADVTPTLPDKTPGGYTSAGSLQALIDDVASRLQAHDLILAKGIRVLPEYAGDLYTRLNELLNKRLSCLMVVALEGVDSKATGMTRSFKQIALTVLCYESVIHNQATLGSRTSALTLAELACGWLHNWQSADGQQVWMQEENTLALDKDRTDLKAGVVCYAARLFTQGCAKYVFP